MSTLRGHEDLRPKAIIGFDMGYALVQCGDGVKRYRLAIGPSGHLTAQPVPDSVVPIDQIGSTETRAPRRFHDIDQPIPEE